MSDIAIKIENLSKQYRLGAIGTGTLSHDLNRWWIMNILGKEDPYLKIGETNQRDIKGTSEYVWALREINLEVKQGEILGIIGKNGAGKSTLLKILSRVTKPSTGIIKYNGRIASLLEVGTGFHPEMTGRENIYMNGTIMGMTRSEITHKLDEIVDFSGIERYIDTPVKRYSSGMTVRLGFAIAAHLEPEILVVDEVLAVGDAEFQKKAIGKMQDVSRGEGRTVMFVSHNLDSISALCNKSVLLEDGKILKLGNTDRVILEYIKVSKNNEGGDIKVSTPDFEFLGIKNLMSLMNLSLNDDISFELGFQSNIDIKNVYIDLGVYNSKDQMILHTKAKFISTGFDFDKNRECRINYKINSPKLASGEYFLTIYVYNQERVLYWCDKLKAFNINSLNLFENNATMLLDDIKGFIVPTFSINKCDK
ncbi:MAG: ABC transporter ATP-binding protein, partial [Ignavibacteria bacterium]|nr:ABC transporter ATP-binding protein [Ignavibacteria bacterium]